MMIFSGPDILVVLGVAVLLLNRKRPNRPGASPAGDDSLLRPNSHNQAK
jgi:hypothetical protein